MLDLTQSSRRKPERDRDRFLWRSPCYVKDATGAAVFAGSTNPMIHIWERFGSTITPIGAALAEAGCDEELRRMIEDRFQKFGECPTSALFPTIESVEEFYEHSFGIVGISKLSHIGSCNDASATLKSGNPKS